MSRSPTVLTALVALVLTTAPAAPVGANTYDKLTYLTFSGPVHIPGVILEPGTYSFRLANPDTSRNVIQVLSHDGLTVYSMFHTMTDHRSELTDEPTVTFKEAPAGMAPSVKSLFYGGEHRGYEFVYGSKEPMMVRAEHPQPPIAYMYNPPAAAPAAEPAFEPVAAEPVAVPPVETVAPELPRTATGLPWVTVGGLASLLLGLGVALVRRHLN